MVLALESVSSIEDCEIGGETEYGGGEGIECSS